MRNKPAKANADATGARAEARINGVDLTALSREIGDIRAQRPQGRFRFRARNRWLDGGHTRTTVKDFRGAGAEQTGRARPLVIESDLPALIRGSDRAVFPLELMLVALASCLTTTLVWHASERGVHLDAVETQVEGDIDLAGSLGIDTNVLPGYRAIRATVTLESDAADAALDDLLENATRSSPVFDTIRRCTNITVSRKHPVAQ